VTPSQRLIARLRAMGLPLADDTTLARTHAGYWQRKGGAWSWMLWSDTDSAMTKYGSQHTVTALLREPRLVATFERRSGMWHVDPYDPRTDERAWPEGIVVEAERALP
jgi:hypothetical protein